MEIYLLLPETCPKYSNRATHEQNKDIKRFWLKVVADNP